MKPTYEAFAVKEVAGDNDQSRNVWRKIGVAWDHKDGRGINVQLDLVPVAFDGRLVLREPIESEAAEDAAPAADEELPI